MPWGTEHSGRRPRCFRWRDLLLSTLFGSTVIVACGGGGEPTGGGAAAPPSQEAAGPSAEGAASSRPLFVERAAETGLDFVHFNGMSGELYYLEILAPGAALFDYDGDGDLDLYLPQGHMLGPGRTLAQATFPPKGPLPLRDRLYRNDLEIHPDGSRTLHFTDVTDESGIDSEGYGMAVAVGDYDNDGHPDLYVTNWGEANRLFHNNGDGTFTDVTDKAGVGDKRWSLAAAFVDYDGDGDLDLFVGNYLDFTFSMQKECTDDLGRRDYCGPISYKPVRDALYRNRGDGTFEDVTGKAGLAGEVGWALGVVTGDFNGDGRMDIYVANDEMRNYLWIQQPDGTFRDEGLLAGAAVNSEGHAEASMGVDAADADGDGLEDLFMAHLTGETNTFYRNQGGGLFSDSTTEMGLALPSWDYTSFGAGFLDYDNDGWPDLLVVNGAIKAIKKLLLAGDPFPLHQPNQLFHNLGHGRFEEVTAQAGKAFELSEVSRGAAFGDVDNDGDTDVVVTNNAGPVRLLLNQVGQDHHWLGLRLVGRHVERDMLGAWVEVQRPGGRTLYDRVRTEGSYASASDPRLLFGLGDDAAISEVKVTWPDGSVETWSDVAPDRYTTLEEGTGRAVPR